MITRKLNYTRVALLSSILVVPMALAAPGGGETTETAASNLSFPVIFPEGVSPAGFPVAGPWKFATITAPETECAQQDPPVASVPDSVLCYYGQQNLGIDEATGDRTFVGDVKVWWLQQRAENFWKAFSVKDDSPSTRRGGTAVRVTAVDFGDLLESSPKLNTRQIRTEVSLLQNASLDPDFSKYIAAAFDPVNGTCVLNPWVPSTSQPDNCFAAMSMSGAVPGTDRSINEIQGSDFGPGTGAYPGTGTVLDPTTVKPGFHSTVYSYCARLVIQRVTSDPAALKWNSTLGYWVNGANAPVVNIAAYPAAGTTGAYTAEINAGGTLLYGYNWNARRTDSGKFRITFVLDGANKCPGSNTKFDANTLVANPGEVSPAQVVSNIALRTLYGGSGTEGGLAYVDVTLQASGSSASTSSTAITKKSPRAR